VGLTTLGYGAMKAGTVIQTVIHDFQDETINTTDSDVDFTGSSFNFTPKLSSSLLIISYNVQVQTNIDSADGNGCTIHIVHDGSNVSAAGADFEIYQRASSGGNHNFYSRFSREVSVSAGSTSARVIKLAGRPNLVSNSGRIRVNAGGNLFNSSIKVQEIRQ
tara:strand:+ start:199 stop:684 length:486 start_codon:yes stop_codon:yes gene_type:complete